MDSQTIEILGRHELTSELVAAGLEVAVPLRDRGIDLIAYVDRDQHLGQFSACPIQMKASSRQSFGLDAKYRQFHNLILAYVWHLKDPRQTCETYALTYTEALAVARDMGWTDTASWKKGSYVTTRPSTRLRDLLGPFRMSPERWWDKVTALQQETAAPRDGVG